MAAPATNTAAASTSILRQLVDAGTLSNLPGGLKSRGLRIKGDDTPIAPGESFRYHQPALPLVLEKLPNTLRLALFSLSLTVVLGIPLGIWAGSRPNSPADWLVSLLTFVAISIPSF